MINYLNIPERPINQRCWVVRAQGGNYVAHFRKSGIVAIGHVDKFYIEDNEPFFPDLGELKRKFISRIPSSGDRRSKRKALNHFSQTKNFLAQFSIGDLVVTIDGNNLMVGRVIGHPYITRQPIEEYDPYTRQRIQMSFHLRRKVQWGPIMDRANLPMPMKRSISAWQTVFNIDKYWEYLYHLLYPVFRQSNNLYFSTRINQRESINNYSISLLFNILTEIEALSNAYQVVLGNPDIHIEDILFDYIGIDNLCLASTAEFMSPGSIWSKVGFTKESAKKWQ